MAKKKHSAIGLVLKKISKTSKGYTDEQIDLSKLRRYEKGTANTGYLKTIILSSAKTQAAAEADANRIEIDIPKDFLVKKGKSHLLTVVAGTGDNEGKWMVTKVDSTAVAEPYEAPSTVTGAGQWMDLVINTKDTENGSETDDHLSINVTELMDIYTNGDGLSLDNKVFSIKLKKVDNADASGLEVSSDGLAIKIDSSNANGLSITAEGLKLALATPSTNGAGGSNGAMSAQDKENLDNLVEDMDLSLISDAEIGSWYGYAADSEMVTTTLPGVSDDSITDEA